MKNKLGFLPGEKGHPGQQYRGRLFRPVLLNTFGKL